MTLIAKLKKRLYFVAAGYFRFFANFALRRWHPRVIAITGSAGKTTMLHFVEFELGRKAHYSHDANSAFGIAFDLVGIKGITGSKLRWIYLILAVPLKSIWYKHQEEFYIVEIDGERPKETEFLASWLKPEITLWISLGRSHAVQFEKQVEEGEFESLDKAITHEFAMLPEYTTHKIYIDADVHLMERATYHIKRNGKTQADVVKCKKSELTDYSVSPQETKFVISGTKFHFIQPQPKDIAIQLVMLKKLCEYLKIPLNADFTTLVVPPGRSSYFAGKNGLKLIDSSYNAHIISMKSILEMAKELKCRHKWLVIGDIVDQGSIEQEEHTALADLIIAAKPEQVVLVGRRTKKYTYPALKGQKFAVKSTDTPQEALRFIKARARNQETLIFKGSQYLEWIIEQLLLNPADAKYLPRRDKAAIRRRQKRGLS